MVNSEYFALKFVRRIPMKRLSLIFTLFLMPWVLEAQPHGPLAKPAPPVPHPGTGQPAPAPVPASTFPKGMEPKIFFPSTEFNFHNVDEAGDITHIYRFTNRGKSTLIINNVSTSCGCTAAVGDKKEIPPGGRGTIKATYHTAGRPGQATKIITVTSNDPKNPSLQIKLMMNVVREVEVQPGNVYMYNVKKGEARTGTVQILGKPGAKFKVLSAESTSHVVSVAMTPLTIVNGKEQRFGAAITVTLPVTLGIGPFADSIKVKTTSRKKPDLDVPVSGEVVGRVQYNPKQISFQPRQNGQDGAVTIQLTVNDPKGFAIRQVTSQKHLARPHIQRTTGLDGIEQYQLVVTAVKHLSKDSDGKDEVDIYTNDADMGKIAIPVTIPKL